MIVYIVYLLSYHDLSSPIHQYHHLVHVILVSDNLKSPEQVTEEAYKWPGSRPVRFAHDPKLVLPSHNYYTGEQVLQLHSKKLSSHIFIDETNVVYFT